MKMAKASTADMEMAMKLCTALEWLERGDMPPDARAPDEEDNDDFDSEDAEHCYRALKEVLGIVRSGSIARVVWGMYVLLDPANKVVDPDADTLEDHPDTVAAMKDAERMDWLADPANTVGNVQLPTAAVTANIHSLRDAIDAAMAMPANVAFSGGCLCAVRSNTGLGGWFEKLERTDGH